MAGNWLYDRFFGERHSSGGLWGGNDSFGPTGGSAGSDIGSDFTSTGTDLDDSSQPLPEADDLSSGGDIGGGFDDASSGDFDSGSSGGDV